MFRKTTVSTPNAFRSCLDDKLRQAFLQEWDPKRPSRVEVIEEGDLIGLRFFVRRRDGSWSAVHEEPPVVLASQQSVNGLLARGLSVFLMRHPGWPR